MRDPYAGCSISTRGGPKHPFTFVCAPISRLELKKPRLTSWRRSPMRTQVGIVGAGPAGLLLSHLLHLDAASTSVDLESSHARGDRSHDPGRRAGAGHCRPDDRDRRWASGMKREGFVHHGFELRFAGRSHRIDLQRPDRRPGDHRLRPARGAQGSDQGCGSRRAGRSSSRPRRRGLDGRRRPTSPRSASPPRMAKSEELACDFVAGCDGSHGVCRAAIPEGRSQGLLPHLPVRLVRHPGQGAAVLGRTDLRPPRARLRAGQHPLARRAAPLLPVRPQRHRSRTGPTTASGRSCRRGLAGEGFRLKEGAIFQKGIIPLRSFVCEPMQYGRLFLAGDAAHSCRRPAPRA